MAIKLKIENVRISFPQLYEPKTVNGVGKAAFSASFLMTPSSQALMDVRAALQQAATEKWKDRGAEMLKSLTMQNLVCLRSGDMKSNYEGYAGNWSISTRSETRPAVRDRNPQFALSAADDKAKAGDYVNASIEIWAMDNQYGKRICAGLRWVQFIALGDRFSGGGSPVSEDEFDDLSMPGDVPGGQQVYDQSEYA